MIKLKKIIQKAVVVLITSIVTFSSSFSTSASDMETELNNTEWNAYVQESTDIDKTPGTALCVVKGSEFAYKNWGYGDIDAQIPVTEDTAFKIGSCSKAFTALSIFLLQEEGKLSIDDSVSEYIPWWNVTWQEKKQM